MTTSDAGTAVETSEGGRRPAAAARPRRKRRRAIGALLLAALVQTAGGASASQLAPGLDGMGGALLAGKLEETVPKWRHAIERRDEAVPADWEGVLEALVAEPAAAQITAVNFLVNQVRYREDPEAWGIRDYWATPREFVQRGGDCEDYAVAKYLALRRLGFAAERLFVMVARDEVEGTSHAVLLVLQPEGALVLDNRIDLIVPWRELSRYRPVYWVNETSTWYRVAAR